IASLPAFRNTTFLNSQNTTLGYSRYNICPTPRILCQAVAFDLPRQPSPAPPATPADRPKPTGSPMSDCAAAEIHFTDIRKPVPANVSSLDSRMSVHDPSQPSAASSEA
ncbi:hypothetical protein SB861_53235, partial [Paraburkholderia sp. SIMBA_049]